MVSGRAGPAASGSRGGRYDAVRAFAADVADWVVRLAPVLVGLALFAFLRPMIMPGVGFWDTAEFQTVGPLLGTAHPTGYPTYVVLGFVTSILLSPIGEPAYRMNLLSLASVAVAAGLLVHLIDRRTGRTLVAVAAGVGMTLTPIAWSIATRADAHALHVAFVALLLVLLARWEEARGDALPGADRWLVAAAVAYGLAAGNHSLTVLLALPIGLYVLAVHPGVLRRPRLVLACLGGAVATMAVVYLELPLRAGPFRAPMVYGDPTTWAGFWYIVLAEQFRGVMHAPLDDLAGKAIGLARLTEAQLGSVALLVPLGFLATARWFPRLALLTGSAVLVTVVFNAAYTNADLTRYYLGPLLIAWLWLGVLGATIVDQVVLGDGVARRAVSVIVAVALLTETALAYPARVSVLDVHADTTAERWLAAAFDQIEPNAVVVSWWSYSTPIWYAQYVEGRRTDIVVMDDRTRMDLEAGEVPDVIKANLGRRPVYVIRATGGDIGRLAAAFELVPLEPPAGNIYRVLGPRATP